MKAMINEKGDLVISSSYSEGSEIRIQEKYVLSKFKEDFNTGVSGVYLDIEGKPKLLIQTDSGDNPSK